MRIMQIGVHTLSINFNFVLFCPELRSFNYKDFPYWFVCVSEGENKGLYEYHSIYKALGLMGGEQSATLYYA